MHPMAFLSFSLCLLPLLTEAVSVTLNVGGNNPMALMLHRQVCNNLRPGRCCQSAPLPQLPGLFDVGGGPQPQFRNYRSAQWTDLAALDIAAVWQPQGSTGGCSGRPVGTNTGPGSWRYPNQGDADTILTGASYIKLPRTRPTDDQETAWVEAEGILGLITGGGTWVSKQARSPLLQQAADAALRLAGGSHKPRRRGVISREKGVVFAQPPGESVWPDSIVINGTNYVEEGAGSLVYKSEAGEVLNLTVASP
ncbi:MAG: hypothetical protein Q9225_005423 [Loekoesia sp. 1 TL-2023]